MLPLQCSFLSCCSSGPYIGPYIHGPLISASSPGPFCYPGPYPLKRLKCRAMILLLCLTSSLRILNSTILCSLQPRLPLAFKFLTSSSSFISTRSSLAPLLLAPQLPVPASCLSINLGCLRFCVIFLADIRLTEDFLED